MSQQQGGGCAVLPPGPPVEPAVPDDAQFELGVHPRIHALQELTERGELVVLDTFALFVGHRAVANGLGEPGGSGLEIGLRVIELGHACDPATRVRNQRTKEMPWQSRPRKVRSTSPRPRSWSTASCPT